MEIKYVLKKIHVYKIGSQRFIGTTDLKLMKNGAESCFVLYIILDSKNSHLKTVLLNSSTPSPIKDTPSFSYL